ncbi:hypothetical protein HJFPF1_04279 [Paramyrothecium foliicola]|nr:hypothetical protein HJFPF1_04279 [Paramyrothecium foliicola]
MAITQPLPYHLCLPAIERVCSFNEVESAAVLTSFHVDNRMGLLTIEIASIEAHPHRAVRDAIVQNWRIREKAFSFAGHESNKLMVIVLVSKILSASKRWDH